jgi:tRNA(Arg) A34 adenosine deaminase TadA
MTRRSCEAGSPWADKTPARRIGCVIVVNGEIVGEGHNEVDAGHDPTAHAETVAPSDPIRWDTPG